MIVKTEYPMLVSHFQKYGHFENVDKYKGIKKFKIRKEIEKLKKPVMTLRLISECVFNTILDVLKYIVRDGKI